MSETPQNVERLTPGSNTPKHASFDPLALVLLYHLLRIHSSKSKPSDSCVALPYRGHWLWINDRDLKSKRAFAFMLMLFTLSDTG